MEINSEYNYKKAGPLGIDRAPFVASPDALQQRLSNHQEVNRGHIFGFIPDQRTSPQILPPSNGLTSNDLLLNNFHSHQELAATETYCTNVIGNIIEIIDKLVDHNRKDNIPPNITALKYFGSGSSKKMELDIPTVSCTKDCRRETCAKHTEGQSATTKIPKDKKYIESKPFKCKECSYSTGKHSLLVKHKLNHSQFKKLRCPICGYSRCRYNQKEAYRLHMKRRHGIVDPTNLPE